MIAWEIIMYISRQPWTPLSSGRLHQWRPWSSPCRRSIPNTTTSEPAGGDNAPIVNKSVQLTPGNTWNVWRRQGWWAAGQRMPKPDSCAVLDDQDSSEEDQGLDDITNYVAGSFYSLPSTLTARPRTSPSTATLGSGTSSAKQGSRHSSRTTPTPGRCRTL